MGAVRQIIRPGAWVDTIAPITPALARALVDAGKQGVFRYVPFAQPSGDQQTDRASFLHGLETGCILDAGLQLGLVSDVRNPPWLPRLANGALDGRVAASRAHAVGYPAGCHLWLDWEGVAGNATDAAIYLDAWAEDVRAAGYRPALYVGYSAILSPDALYGLPGYDSYWQASGSHVATRGFAVRQGRTVTIAGVDFDEDVVAPDRLGELPLVAGAEDLTDA